MPRSPGVVGNWLLISRFRDDVNTVIQLNVSETSRSSGFLSVMVVNSPTQQTPAIQNQGATRELSRTNSEDDSSSSTLTVLQSNESMSTFIHSLLQLRMDAGWQLSFQKQYTGSQVVLMNRQSQRVEMVISEVSPGTIIAVMNEVRYAN
jgi:hypothetical protein